MIGRLKSITSMFFTGLILAPSLAFAHEMVEVTITNITKGEIFTPIMVASHRRDAKLFTLGQPASTELEILAESGNTAPLTDMLLNSGAAFDVVTSGGVLPPGASVTLKVKSDDHNKFISVASMLVPTNDAFFSINGIRTPKKGHNLVLTSPAYDAGTEDNDEDCASIPGPPFICQGEGYNVSSGEGYVHIHSGIQGHGNLDASKHDWRNPVAQVTIRRVKK